MADPTVGDVFNQLVLTNGKLDNIDTNTFGVANALNNLDSDVTTGFKATVDMLKIIALIDIEAVKLLFHLAQQTDTMICALEHISENTCGILTQVTIQTELQKRIRDDADALRDLAESAYPGATVEQQRLAALRAEVERCCPPEEPKPACTYEPCPQPRPLKMPDLPKIPKDAEIPKEPQEPPNHRAGPG
jgi:hypothetical protein